MYVMESFGLSGRRASSVIGTCRNTLRYEARQDKDKALRRRIKDLAEKRQRFGYRRLHVLLKREGLVVNHKRTERIYREEKLALRIRRRKKLASQGRIEIPRAGRANALWAMDFLHDVLHDGRKLRFLPIIDTYTRECFRIEVDTSISGKRVVAILSQIAGLRGLPDNIVVDNGPEFIGNALDAWAYERGVKLHFIRPGKPVDNAYMESFNGRFRDECLNLHWFMSVGHARDIAEDYRVDYNNERPHSSLGDLTPAEFTRLEEEKAVGVL
jgi:putative transposase